MNKIIATIGTLVGSAALIALPVNAQAADTSQPVDCQVKLNDKLNCTTMHNATTSDDPVWAFSKPGCTGYVQRVWPGKGTSHYHPFSDWESLGFQEKGTSYRIVFSNYDSDTKHTIRGTSQSGWTCFARFPNYNGDNKVWINLYDPHEH